MKLYKLYVIYNFWGLSVKLQLRIKAQQIIPPHFIDSKGTFSPHFNTSEIDCLLQCLSSGGCREIVVTISTRAN